MITLALNSRKSNIYILIIKTTRAIEWFFLNLHQIKSKDD